MLCLLGLPLCEREGRALTQQSGADAILQRMAADSDAPKVLENATQRTIDGLVRELLNEVRISSILFLGQVVVSGLVL